MRIFFLFFIVISLSLHAELASSDGVAVDDETGLNWQDDSDTVGKKMEWEEAVDYCQKLKLNGFDDWYLPKVEELLSVTDKRFYKPAAKKGFQNIKSDRYWSSSTAVNDAISGWGVNFKFGGTGTSRDKATLSYVRCVRQGQYTTLPFSALLSKVMKEELEKSKDKMPQTKLFRDNNETDEAFLERVVKNKAIKRTLEISWGEPILYDLEYDAPKAYFTFYLTFKANKDFVRKVGLTIRNNRYAIKFKREFKDMKPEAVFDYDGRDIRLKEVRIPHDYRVHTVTFLDDKNDDMLVVSNISNKFDEEGLKHYNEIENLIDNATSKIVNTRKWLFVVGVEKYDHVKDLPYARRSAEMFARTAQKKFGISGNNTYVLVGDSTTEEQIKNNMLDLVSKIKKGDTVYFYYAGHGIPIKSLHNEPFILASDSDPETVVKNKFMSLRNLYNKLGFSNAGKVIVFVDSCFNCIYNKRYEKIEPRKVTYNKDKVVIVNATEGVESTNRYDKKEHRMFSYYLMKNILDGTDDLLELFEKTKKQTHDTSIQEHGELKAQTPSLDGNTKLAL